MLQRTSTAATQWLNSRIEWLEMETTMKRILLAAAALMLATPAFAQSYTPEVGSGNIGNTQAYRQPAPSGIYQGAEGAFAQVPAARRLRAPNGFSQAPAAWRLYQGGKGAFAQDPAGPSLRSPNGFSGATVPVYDEYGRVIGSDPDPNVRLQLRKDHDTIQ
jgi:hypothetical protein